MFVFPTACDFDSNTIIIMNLIVDAAKDKVFLNIITNKQSYTNEYSNTKENFDKIGIIIFEFLEKNNFKLEEIKNLYVNIMKIVWTGKAGGRNYRLCTARGIVVGIVVGIAARHDRNHFVGARLSMMQASKAILCKSLDIVGNQCRFVQLNVNYHTPIEIKANPCEFM